MTDLADLALVPTDELVDELTRRSDAGLIIVERHLGGAKPDEHELYRWGSLGTVIGLLVIAKAQLVAAFLDGPDEPPD